MKLSEKIYYLRKQAGWNQETLADRVGVSRQAVSKWEVGDAIPDTDKLIPLARALGITVDELLGNDTQGEETTSPPITVVVEQKKEPGWFALHWYWLGLIPAAWGLWQLLWLLVIILNIAGATGGFHVTTSAGAIPTG